LAVRLSEQVFMGYAYYRDKVVGVFVRFRAPLRSVTIICGRASATASPFNALPPS
jgi:hypothetical protein